MKQTPIAFKFDAAKLKALQYYLPKNGTTVEEELRKHLNEIYDEQVPKDVKDFVHFQANGADLTEDHSQDQTSEDADESGGGKNKKQTRRQKNDSSTTQGVESSSPSMGMNM